ncbi:MAG: Gldg family protein, partial [Deltaproteobacteria bacterium]|nr:Gldg family protein [Deltaproteobacteria bacterium]
YKLEEVDLQGGDTTIDAELRGVIVLQADEDWTDKELGRIDQFLMAGDKSLLAMAGAVNMKAADASMKASLSTRGLERLLDGYGIEMKEEAIVDSGSQVRIPLQDQGGQMTWLTAPGVIELKHDADAEEAKQTLDNSFAGFFRLDELAFPYPSVLIPHPDKQPGAKITVVARSSATSTLETSATIDLRPQADWKATGKAGQHAIAVTVEGKLRSAFGDQPPAGIEIGKESVKPSRVLVIASPQFLANPFARAGNPPPMPPQMKMMGGSGGDKTLQMLATPYARKYLTATILAFKNQLDWIAGDERLIACSALLIAPPSEDEATKAAESD